MPATETVAQEGFLSKLYNCFGPQKGGVDSNPDPDSKAGNSQLTVKDILSDLSEKEPWNFSFIRKDGFTVHHQDFTYAAPRIVVDSSDQREHTKKASDSGKSSGQDLQVPSSYFEKGVHTIPVRIQTHHPDSTGDNQPLEGCRPFARLLVSVESDATESLRRLTKLYQGHGLTVNSSLTPETVRKACQDLISRAPDKSDVPHDRIPMLTEIRTGWSNMSLISEDAIVRGYGDDETIPNAAIRLQVGMMLPQA